MKTSRDQLLDEGRKEGSRQELLLILEKQLKKKLETTYIPGEVLSLMKESKIEALRRVSECIFDITSFVDVGVLLLKKNE